MAVFDDCIAVTRDRRPHAATESNDLDLIAEFGPRSAPTRPYLAWNGLYRFQQRVRPPPSSQV